MVARLSRIALRKVEAMDEGKAKLGVMAGLCLAIGVLFVLAGCSEVADVAVPVLWGAGLSSLAGF